MSLNDKYEMTGLPKINKILKIAQKDIVQF